MTIGRPIHDVTPEESLKNFKQHSMLNARDITLTLDGWLDKIEKNDLNVPLCEDSRKVLKKTVESMRDFVLSNQIPAILPELTGQEYRYTLYWYDDGLQLGIERYAPEAVFDVDGEDYVEPVFLEEDEEPEDTDAETWYVCAHKVQIPFWPIDKWAEANNVRTPTARQWANRQRIETIKENGALRISSIAYTPDGKRKQKDQRYRFNMIKTVPQELSKKYPILAGCVLDLIIMPDEENANGYKLLSIHMPENEKGYKTESTKITASEKESILDSLYAVDGVKAMSDKYYTQPFDEGISINSRHPHLNMNTTKEEGKLLKKLQVTGTTRTADAKVAETGEQADYADPSVDFDITATDPATQTNVRLSGKFCIDNPRAETRLLNAIFGWSETMGKIKDAMYAAGIKNPKHATYPWNTNVLLIEKIDADNAFPNLKLILRALPWLVKKATCLRPTLILIDTDEIEHLTGTHGVTAEDFGLEPADKYLYAYAVDDHVFKKF